MLLFLSFIPATSAKTINEESKPEGIISLTIMFARGEVVNITEVVENDIECYRCTAVDVKVTFVSCLFLIPFTIQREHLEDFDDFLIPKHMFRGILREGFVFGLIQWW
jgi:hypothetical protein